MSIHDTIEFQPVSVDGMTASERRQWFSDARALLNMLESRPDVPLPRSLSIDFYSINVTDEQVRAGVGIAAGALAVDAGTTPYGHYRAVYTTGSATYTATAIPSDEQARHDEERRLGAEAYQALHASQDQEASA